MRLSANILLGDPAWLVPSIRSYYDRVSTIVASYDQECLSWAGTDMGPEIRECLRLLHEIDVDGKVILAPGSFSRPNDHPTAAETAQRQAAVDAASDCGDWVVQLDTDEIVQDADLLVEEIEASDRSGADALEYPARWIYGHICGNWFLERATRRLKTWDAIPGPIAVRSGTTLSYCRQAEVPVRGLRFSGATRADTVDLSQAILHFSMVRTSAAMQRKATTSGHSRDLDWAARLRLWEEARRRPALAVARSLTRPHFGTYRPAQLPRVYSPDVVALQTAVGDPDRLRGADRPGEDLGA